MKTKYLLTLAIVALFPALLCAQEATIARLAGAESVTVTLPSGEEAMMGQGDVIPVGSWVEVPTGKLFLRTFSGTVSVFSSGAVFEVTEVEQSAGKEKTRLTLQSGDMVANLDPNKRDVNDYGVVTPKGVAAARGTNYTISVNGQNVVVTVVAGVVTVDIPDVGVVNLTEGTATTGGASTSIAGVLSGGGENAAAARNALRAAAAAVSVLASTGTDGVTSDTLTSVIGVVADVANESGDDSILTEATSDAVEAAPSNAQTVVRAAVARRPAAAQSVVDSATQAVMDSADEDSTVSADDVAQELAAAANETLSSTETETPQAPVDAGEAADQVTDTPEDTPDVEVPTDNITNPVSVTFTIRLSGGRFVTVTLNDQNDDALVQNSPIIVGASTAEIGTGEQVTFNVPPSVIAELGNLTPGQRSNIDTGITAALGDLPVIEVPNNTIIISPSS